MTIVVSATTRTTTMVSSRRSNAARKRLRATPSPPMRPDEDGRPMGRSRNRDLRRFAEGERLVDQLLAAGNVFREFLIDRLAGRDEGILVGLVDLHAAVLQ